MNKDRKWEGSELGIQTSTLEIGRRQLSNGSMRSLKAMTTTICDCVGEGADSAFKSS